MNISENVQVPHYVLKVYGDRNGMFPPEFIITTATLWASPCHDVKRKKRAVNKLNVFPVINITARRDKSDKLKKYVEELNPTCEARFASAKIFMESEMLYFFYP